MREAEEPLAKGSIHPSLKMYRPLLDGVGETLFLAQLTLIVLQEALKLIGLNCRNTRN